MSSRNFSLYILNFSLYILCTFIFTNIGCSQDESQGKILTHSDVVVGADSFLRSDIWMNKKLGFVVNHSSILKDHSHIIDSLSQKANIQIIFAPEHGFRGTADAGEWVADGRDQKTGIPIRSLYGKHKKPTLDELTSLDMLVFDIQDVGVRYYTYLSTLYYCMERAEKADISFVVLDRPNPNGFYVDGPILDTSFRSFVGAVEVPIVHGMTFGEMAHFLNSKYLNGRLDLSVFPVQGYRHRDTYIPPVPPSPNLRSIEAILLYPQLCYFEATTISCGRGTDRPFEQIGHPHLFSKTGTPSVPKPNEGSQHPKFKGQTFYFLDVSTTMPLDSLISNGYIRWNLFSNILKEQPEESLLERPEFLNLLIGTDTWKNFLPAGKFEDFRNSYSNELEIYRKEREKYLLYAH